MPASARPSTRLNDSGLSADTPAHMQHTLLKLSQVLCSPVTVGLYMLLFCLLVYGQPQAPFPVGLIRSLGRVREGNRQLTQPPRFCPSGSLRFDGLAWPLLVLCTVWDVPLSVEALTGRGLVVRSFLMAAGGPLPLS